jgi:hypothetical protein
MNKNKSFIVELKIDILEGEKNLANMIFWSKKHFFQKKRVRKNQCQKKHKKM